MDISKNDLSKIEKKVTYAAKKAFVQFSNDIAEGLYICFASAIDYFYSTYTPNSYYRTKSLYKGTSTYNIDKNRQKIFRPLKTPNGSGYTICMEIDPKYIPGNPYHQKKDPNRTEWVFNRSFYEIIHGFTADENKRWARKPYTYKTKHADQNGVFYYTEHTIEGWTNRFGDPSGWKKQKTVPTIGGSFQVRYSNPFLKNVKPKKEKRNLIYMVRSNFYELRDEVKTFNRYYEIFNQELQKLKG